MNQIMDYEQAEQRLEKMVARGGINQEEDLGTTTYGLPIHHFTIGNGSKEIVVTGATHGCEIISADFVMNLMEKLSQGENVDGIDLNEYKIHFVPILNPEGYLISTSAIRQIIPRDMPSEEAEALCKEYYLRYRDDDSEAIQRNRKNAKLKEELARVQEEGNVEEILRIQREIEETLPDRDPEHLKRFQEMFKEIDYTCIPEKYAGIRERVRQILEKYPDIPKGTLQIWSANANGIDPQSNSKYNTDLIKILNGELREGDQVFKNNLRYSNINSIHPGPINCGFDPERGFQTEPEIGAIASLLQKLSEKGTLHSYFNYHGTGGVLYQRPMNAPEELGISLNEMWTRALDNFALSQFYSRRTYKNANDRANTRYRILTGKGSGKVTSSNDLFRIKYPRDILVELSGMGGNPIGPYGDLQGNYKNLMDSNLDAFRFAVGYSDVSEKISQASYKMIQDKIKSGETDDNLVNEIYGVMGTASKMLTSWLEKFQRKTRWQVMEEGIKRIKRNEDEER